MFDLEWNLSSTGDRCPPGQEDGRLLQIGASEI